MCSGLKLKAILKGIHAKLLQLCPIFVTLWTVARRAPVSGVLQAKIREWVAIPFSRRSP